MNKAGITKRIFSIVLNVLLTLFLIIALFSVFITVSFKRDIDGAAEIFGYQMRVVTTESMEECNLTDVSDYKIKDIPVKSMVFIKTVPDNPGEANEFYSNLKVGDVLTFRYVYTYQITITHRITKITEKDTGGYIIELEGDNKNAENGQLTQVIDTSIPNSTNYVIGKVVGQSYPLGFAVSHLMDGPTGIILLIILPCAIIILLEVVKIFKAISDDKKQRMDEEKAQKENELDELRRRLAELERKSDNSEPPSDSDNK